MNKMKLLMLLILAATGMTVSAADAGFEFVESDGGKTLTIKGYGDLTTASQTSTTTVFSAAANGNVFTNITNNSGTSVTTGANYNPSAAYYIAESKYTQVFDGGAPTNGDYAYSASTTTTTTWNEAAISTNDTYIYEVFLSWDNKITINSERITSGNRSNKESITYKGNTYTKYVKLNRAANWSETFEDESILLTEAQLAGYLNTTSITTYTVDYKYPLYRSQDGGATKQQLTAGQTYTYNDGDLFYTSNGIKYTQIPNNATFFAANPSYLEKKTTTITFKEALRQRILSSSYTKVVFENTGSGELTIDPAIVQNIIAPDATPDAENPSYKIQESLTEFDLSAATTASFDNMFNVTYRDGSKAIATNLATLTLPKTTVVNGVMEVPTGVVSLYKNGDKLSTVIVPDGYTKIGDNAFEENSITTVNLPSTLTEIGDEAFLNCTKLTNINITDDNMEGRSIVFPSSLETIGASAFAGTALASTEEDPFILPSGLKKVKAGAFVNLTNLQFLELNEGLEYVGNGAFGLTSELHAQTSIIFPSTIKYLGPGSFISRRYQDIYFTGETAPVCPVGKPWALADDWGNVTAFSANIQMGNNGFASSADPVTGSAADYTSKGYANRENYVNGGTYITILHFPDGLTSDQAKTYRDITRRYVTANGNQHGSTEFSYGGSIADFNDPATGKTFGSAFKEATITAPDGSTASSLVYYMSANGTLYSYTNSENVQPGYIDTYLGTQQIWPSQSQWVRSFVTVANGVEWDGVTVYRPTLTEEIFNLMKEDGLFVQKNGLDYTQGNPRTPNEGDKTQGGYELSLEGKTFESLTTEERDYLSLILYQGTRRFVLGNDSPYEIPFKMKVEAGRWWSICLPFNMTKKQIDEVFGEGTHVCLFSGVKRTDGNDKLLRLEFINDVYHHKTERTVKNNGSSIVYTYGANYRTSNPKPEDDDIVIYARESYMIYPTEKSGDAAGVAVRNFGTPDFTIGDPLPTMIQANSDTPYKIEDSGFAYRFIGNFNTTASYDKEGNSVPVKIPRYSYAYGQSGGVTKFFILNSDKAVWTPFKSIVQNLGRNGGLDDWNNYFNKVSANVKQVSVFGLDEDITSVEDVIIEVSSDNGADKAVYSISGSHVGDSLQGLAPGVYVKQGKAYIVK